MTESLGISFTLEELLAAACKETGLEDFGDTQFMEGLSIFVDAVRKEANLNAVGRQMVSGGIIRILSNRLRYQRDIKEHPEILKEKIVKPIIITGLPRTGTTKLQRVISADPGVQRLDFWKVIFPAPFSGEKPGNPKPRIDAAIQFEAMFSKQFPESMARHPMEALEPDEELHMMEMSYECIISWLFSRTPSYYDYVSKSDQRATYKITHAMLQYLQWQGGSNADRPWIMKSPVHLGALPVLLETFPDAVLVHCHRDPRDVIPSFASLIEEHRKIGSDIVDPKEIGRDILEYWSDQMNLNLQARETLPSDRILDINYKDIIKDVNKVIARVYEKAGRPVTAEALKAFEGYEARRPKGYWGTYEYTAEQYGVCLDDIDQRFAKYRQRFINV
ncbi:MAG: sulfotransferase [Porticoccaceae bacterium]|nr:sulfotransferase [Porticoccaceae bacterium]